MEAMGTTFTVFGMNPPVISRLASFRADVDQLVDPHSIGLMREGHMEELHTDEDFPVSGEAQHNPVEIRGQTGRISAAHPNVGGVAIGRDRFGIVQAVQLAEQLINVPGGLRCPEAAAHIVIWLLYLTSSSARQP